MDDFTINNNETAILDELASYIYRNLTATRYMKDIKYSEFIHYTKQQLTKNFNEQTELQATIYCIDHLLSLAKQFDTFSIYENRFERYITSLLKKQLPLIENWFHFFHQEQNHFQMEDALLSTIKSTVHPYTYELIEKCLWKIKFHTWQTWLQNPTFTEYGKIQATFSEQEKEASLNYILSTLEKNLFSPSIQLTYLKILIEEARIEEVIDYFLTYEHQPIALNDEKKMILRHLEKNFGEYLLPVYHQFIIRLIDKRTRVHYEEAIVYIKKLQTIYNSSDKTEIFHQYLQLLMKKYSSYRALIQEMKSIEANIQSK